MIDVVVVAEFAERLSATFLATVRTDRSPAVSTFSLGSLTTGHAYVAVTGYVLDLAEWIHGNK